MKQRECDRLGQRLASQLPNVKAKNCLLWETPLGDILRGVYWHSSSYDPRKFDVEVLVQPLFVPAEHVHFTFGFRLTTETIPVWSLDLPNLDDELVEAFERTAKPYLNSAASSMSCAELLQKFDLKGNPNVRENYAACLARSDQVKSATEQWDQLLVDLNDDINWHKEMRGRVCQIRACFLESPENGNALLDKWRRFTLKEIDLLEDVSP